MIDQRGGATGETSSGNFENAAGGSSLRSIDTVRYDQVMRFTIPLILAALVALAGASSGCSSSCDGSCDQQYNECMKTAAPGAARADCSTAHSQCLQSCNSR